MIGEALSKVACVVTGASGFLGGALSRRLLEVGAEVRGAVRDPAKASDLADAGASLVAFDLLDPSTFGAVVEGQEVVFHVAAWVGFSDADADAINIDATRALALAAQEAGVRRFVLVSTVGAYRDLDDTPVTEDHPLALDARYGRYDRTKAQGEVAARRVGDETGLEVVVVRPGMIYGPGSRGWTVGMLKLVKSGTPCVFGRGDGLAFPVYVDNLVDALLLAATVPEAAGEAFHVVDEPVEWKRFMGYYGEMAKRKPRRLPLAVAWLVGAASDLFGLGLPLSRERVKLVRTRVTFDTTKAREVLGWSPRVGMDEGMARAEAWLREVGKLGA